MKKLFKTSLSVICIITMLASLIIPSIVMPASAYSFVEGQDVIRYTFDGDFSVDPVEEKDTAGGAFAISNKMLEVKALDERCAAFNNGEKWLTLEDGAYMVEIKYTYTESQFKSTVGTNTSAKRGTIRSVDKSTFNPTDITKGTDYTDPILTFEEEKIGQELTACAYFEFEGATGRNVAFCAGGKTHCYIKEIAISKKSFVDVVAFDGYNTAPIANLKGVFGDKAELPGKESFEEKNSCEGFQGFYADPKFKKPIITEEFTFPTDVLKTTVYAKMDFVKPVAVNIDFETQIEDPKNTTTYATIDTISKDGNESNKAFKSMEAANFEVGTWGRGKMIYNSDSSHIFIPAGRYTVTWKYMIKGALEGNPTKNKAYFINSYNSNDGNYSAAHTTISGAEFDLLPDKAAPVEEWQEAEEEIFLPEDVENFGIFFTPLQAVVYIDDIVFSPITEFSETISIDFSKHSECDESSIYKVADHTKDGHGNSFGIVFSKYYTGYGQTTAHGQYCEIKQGGSSCGGGVTCTHKTDGSTSLSLKAGTYLIKYSYYITQKGSYEGYDTSRVNPEKFSFKFAYNTGAARPNTTFGEEIIKDLENTTPDQWHTANMFVTLDNNVQTIGFCLLNSTYHIYVDDISINSITLKNNPSLVIDFKDFNTNNLTLSTGLATILNHTGVDGDASNMAFGGTGDLKTYIRGNTLKYKKDNEDKYYSIPAGTYEVTWDYKVCSPDATSTKGEIFFVDGFAANNNSGTDAKNARIKCENFSLIPNRTINSGWQKGRVVITLTEDVEKLGIVSYTFPAGKYYIDNISFAPINKNLVQLSFYDLFRTTDTALEDVQGNEMKSNSAVYKDPNGKLRSAFRFVSSFNYYKSGDLFYLDRDRQIKIIKRGMKVGIATEDKETGIYTYDQKTKSEKAATATAWNNNGANLEYTFMMFNISVDNKDTVYFATPYLVLEIKGKQFVVSGETKKTSVEGIFATSEAKKNNAQWYYQYQE